MSLRACSLARRRSRDENEPRLTDLVFDPGRTKHKRSRKDQRSLHGAGVATAIILLNIISIHVKIKVQLCYLHSTELDVYSVLTSINVKEPT